MKTIYMPRSLSVFVASIILLSIVFVGPAFAKIISQSPPADQCVTSGGWYIEFVLRRSPAQAVFSTWISADVYDQFDDGDNYQGTCLNNLVSYDIVDDTSSAPSGVTMSAASLNALDLQTWRPLDSPEFDCLSEGATCAGVGNTSVFPPGAPVSLPFVPQVCAAGSICEAYGVVSITEQSAGWLSYRTAGFVSGANPVVPFGVVNAGTGDWITMTIDDTEFFRQPVDQYNDGNLHYAVIPLGLVSSGAQQVISVFLESAGAADSSIYMPIIEFQTTTKSVPMPVWAFVLLGFGLLSASWRMWRVS